MHGPLIDLLRAEYASKFEGPVPPVAQLLREAWVPRYLAVMFPAPHYAAAERLTTERDQYADRNRKLVFWQAPLQYRNR